jgi:hypothetical protein
MRLIFSYVAGFFLGAASCRDDIVAGSRSHKEEPCFADELAPTVMPRLKRFDNAAL